MSVAKTNEERRQVLTNDIGRILDDYLCGKIDHPKARAFVKIIFTTPTCRVSVEDITPYLTRVLIMLKEGDMSLKEATCNLVNMEMSFDNGGIYA